MENNPNKGKESNSKKPEITTYIKKDIAKNGLVSSSPPPRPTKSDVKPTKK